MVRDSVEGDGQTETAHTRLMRDSLRLVGSSEQTNPVAYADNPC
jgi:hypothetical protein